MWLTYDHSIIKRQRYKLRKHCVKHIFFLNLMCETNWEHHSQHNARRISKDHDIISSMMDTTHIHICFQSGWTSAKETIEWGTKSLITVEYLIIRTQTTHAAPKQKLNSFLFWGDNWIAFFFWGNNVIAFFFEGIIEYLSECHIFGHSIIKKTAPRNERHDITNTYKCNITK